jgi:hypothetical protein
MSQTNGAAGGAVVVFDPSKFQATVANMAKGAGSRVGFLKMSKAGEWSFGTDEEPVGPEDHVYVDPMGFVHGWQCWADTEVPGVQAALLDDVVVPMFDPLPAKPEKVPDTGRGWSEMRGLSCLLGSEKLVYSTTSVGGLNAIATLAEDYAKQFAKNPKKMIAVVSLLNDSYKHKNKTYGKIYTPVLSVVDWVDQLPEVNAMPHPPKLPPLPAKKAPAKKAPMKAAKKGA